MKIIVDTREQLPFFMRVPPENCSSSRCKLEVGDYSTSKLKYTFAIERKSGADLYGTITRGHRRFKNMLMYAKALEIKIAVYVECSYKNFVSFRFPGGEYCRISERTITKIINTLEVRGLEIVWCKTRNECKRKIYERLRKEERKIT